MQKKIGMVIALASEASAMLGRTRWRHTNGGQACVVQLQNDLQLVVLLSGMGAHNAEAAAAELLSHGVASMVSAGLAGGLDPELKAGDIVIATEVRQIVSSRIDGPWLADPHCVALAQERLSRKKPAIRCGAILTTTKEALTCSQKASLSQQSGALTVDMESAAVARLAGQAHIPFFGLRSVCDPADRTVPEGLFNSLDPDGRIRLSSVLQTLLRQPALISDMVRMGLAFSSARRSLRDAWRLLLDAHLPQELAAIQPAEPFLND